MSICWKITDWQLPCSYFGNSTVKLFFQSLLIAQNGTITTLLRFDAITCKPMNNAATIEIKEECLDIFEVDETIYYLSKEGSVFQLICTSSGGSNDAFGFGSTCSSTENEVYSWLNLRWNAKNAVAVTGLKQGFAAIVKIETSFYYNIYSIKKQLNLRSSSKLPSIPTPLQWTLSHMESSKLSPDMRQHFFKELAFVVQDVVLLSTPTGQLFMFPGSFDSTINDDWTLHWETLHQLIHVHPVSSKNMIILVYGNGRVVCLKLEKEKLDNQTYYLPSVVKNVQIIETNGNLFIIWCDKIKINAGCLANSDLKVFKSVKTLYGVETMFSVGEKILACNTNQIFYELALNTSEADLQPLVLNAQLILTEMSTLGVKMDDVNKEIEKRNIYLNAIAAEQSAGEKIIVRLNRDSVHLENQSEFLFVKDIWSVLFEGRAKNSRECSSFLLEHDLQPGVSILLPLLDSVKICDSLNVMLIGNIVDDGRLLKVTVGNIVLQSTNGLDFISGLEEKLKGMKLNCFK